MKGRHDVAYDDHARRETGVARARCCCTCHPWLSILRTASTTRRLPAGTVFGICLLSLCGALTCAVAAPANWSAELLAPPTGSRAPTAPIRLRLPVLPPATIQQLALELDDVDVSAMATIEGRDVVFAPPQPLGWGAHQLRLVEHTADGNIREVGVWNIEIRRTTALREAGLQSSASLNGNQRIADDNLTQPEPKTFQADGGAQLQGTLANGSWRTTGQMDLLYSSQRQLMPRGENGTYVDVGTFLLTYEQGPVVARAGHHSAAPDSLILSGFQRRGVSLGAQSHDLSFGMTAFSSATQDVVGFVQGLGIGDSSNVTNGITLSARPFGSRPEALALAATYLSGKDPGPSNAGSGAASGSTVATQGKAADILLDSQLLERRLRLRGEYAWTQFDIDGEGSDTNSDGVIDSNLQSTRDSAYAVLATYTPWHDKVIKDSPFVWMLGVEQRKLGTFFKSPAAPTGIADRAMVRAFTAMNWSGLDAQVSLGNETDNVNDLDLVPRTRTGQRFASLAYTPQINRQPRPDGSLPELPWYGQPQFNVSYTGVTQEIEKSGANLSTGPLNDSSTFLFVASFTYLTWSWSANYTSVDVQNRIGTTVDTNNNTVGLNANFRFAEKLTLTPRIQYSLDEQSDPPPGVAATDTGTTTAGITVGYAFSERLVASLQYDLNRQDTPCGCQDSQTQDVTGSLTWMAVPARESKPGVTFSVDGRYHDAEDQGAVTAIPSTYQVFFKMGVSWAPSL
jgi:hypothetical protein